MATQRAPAGRAAHRWRWRRCARRSARPWPWARCAAHGARGSPADGCPPAAACRPAVSPAVGRVSDVGSGMHPALQQVDGPQQQLDVQPLHLRDIFEISKLALGCPRLSADGCAPTSSGSQSSRFTCRCVGDRDHHGVLGCMRFPAGGCPQAARRANASPARGRVHHRKCRGESTAQHKGYASSEQVTPVGSTSMPIHLASM